MYYIVKRSLLSLYFLFPVQPPTLYSWCATVSSLAAIIIRDMVCVYFLCLIEIARTKNWLLKQENLMSGRITRDFVLLTWGGDTVVHTFTSTQKPTDSPCFSAEGEMHHVIILLGPGRNETQKDLNAQMRFLLICRNIWQTLSIVVYNHRKKLFFVTFHRTCIGYSALNEWRGKLI